MATARTSQLNSKDEKNSKSELDDAALSNMPTTNLAVFEPSIQNMKNNLESLNVHLTKIVGLEDQQPSKSGVNLYLGRMSVDSPLGELNARAIKLESDDNMLMDDQGGSSSPRKRQRRSLKMEVCVPTMDLLRHERLKAEEDCKKLDKMRNPNVKMKKDMMLSLDTVRLRFKVLGPSALDLYPITLDKGSQDVAVSRDFMSAEYGGSLRSTCPNIGKHHLEKHGMDDFMYLHPNYQPVAPQVPGACGLFLGINTIGRTWPVLQRVFTRIKSNVWQYMGTYRLTPSPSLTPREWADQERKVQNTWGREICRKNWGLKARIRVFSRKRLGREPTKNVIEGLSTEGGQRYSVTPEEVIASFTKGELILGAWLMECVGYDNAFQLELCDKFPIWVPPPKKTKNPQSSADSSAKKSTATGPRKRKREENANLDVDLNPKDEDESEPEAADWQEPKFDYLSEHEDDIQELTYIPRGTRSRPICL